MTMRESWWQERILLKSLFSLSTRRHSSIYLLFLLLFYWAFEQEVKMLQFCLCCRKWTVGTCAVKTPEDIRREIYPTILNKNKITKRFSHCSSRVKMGWETWMRHEHVWYERDSCMLVLLQQQHIQLVWSFNPGLAWFILWFKSVPL